MTHETPVPFGRPSTYSAAVADTICDRLAAGESLRTICSEQTMPCESAVYKWLREEKEDFVQKYVRARASQAERMLDEILEIADDTTRDTVHTDKGPAPNTEWINRSKLRVETRKWAMAKLAPKKYGDKMDLTTGGEPIKSGPAVFQILPASQRPPDTQPEEE